MTTQNIECYPTRGAKFVEQYPKRLLLKADLLKDDAVRVDVRLLRSTQRALLRNKAKQFRCHPQIIYDDVDQFIQILNSGKLS